MSPYSLYLQCKLMICGFCSGTVNVSLPQYMVPERVSLNSYKLYNVEGKKIIGWIMELVY